MTSLKLRIPLLATVVLAVSLGVATLLAYELLLITGRSDLEEALRDEQRRFHRSLPRLLERVEGPAGPPDGRSLLLAARRYMQLDPGTDAYLVIVRIGGEVLRSEEGPAALGRLEDRAELPVSRSPGMEVFDTVEGDVLSLTRELEVADRTPATVQVAAPLAPVRAQAGRALTRLGLAALVSLVLGAAVLALTLRRALRPLHALSSMARAAELEQLSLRVPEPDRPDEVGVLAREFNQMLERLEAAVGGQREFMATVSHELRTPVTIARGHIELLESLGSENAEDRRQVVSLVREELLRVQRLVEDLMALARSRTDDFVIKGAVSLPDFFRELELRVAGLGIRPITFRPPDPIQLEADEERLAQAVLNLVVNADVHTPSETRIEVATRVEADRVGLVVADDGPGVDPSVAPTMFEPFVTGEDGRDRGSSGLGLAVVALVVEAHGGTIDVSTGSGGTAITLWLPAHSGRVA